MANTKGDFLSKGNSIFCRGQYIIENANRIFGNIFGEKYLHGLSKSNFIERMAYYMGEVNALHPFREGNGRTAREFFRQLSLNANYILDFSKIEKEELLEADIGLVRQPGWLSPKSCKMLRILRFLSGSCSKTEVPEQLY
ncbi:MAG: Fic family protein [Spirochaetaceae bacterium]|jgi:cell filamentation protein|nr:Fic family protein [Spirochaetaceae bacterium]